MAEEKTNITPELIKAEKKPSMFNPKVLMIGLPIFVVQLVAVYFITANILLCLLYTSDAADERSSVDFGGRRFIKQKKNKKKKKDKEI